MKITSISLNLEINKDENGYSNYYYVDITERGINVSNPYIMQNPEQVMFVNNLVNDFITQAIAFNTRVDGFNRDNHLEQYAPQQSTEEIVSESTDVSAVPQTCALGDGEVSTGADGDIDKPKSTIVITKVTEEDNW